MQEAWVEPKKDLRVQRKSDDELAVLTSRRNGSPMSGRDAYCTSLAGDILTMRQGNPR